MPDFTNCRRLPGSAYNGANGKKIAIEYQGERYMLKFPPSGAGKRTELSYTNMAAENEDCNAAVIRMFPRFDMDAICQFIDEVPFLDVMQKRFYQTYVTARCEKIIMPAYEQIMEQRQNQSPVLDM